MIPISECRKYMPADWSDDQIELYREKLYSLAHITFSLYKEQIQNNLH